MNPPLAELSLTQEEATALSTEIDIATKSGGINVAGEATHLYEKHVKACEVFKPKS